MDVVIPLAWVTVFISWLLFCSYLIVLVRVPSMSWYSRTNVSPVFGPGSRVTLSAYFMSISSCVKIVSKLLLRLVYSWRRRWVVMTFSSSLPSMIRMIELITTVTSTSMMVIPCFCFMGWF